MLFVGYRSCATTIICKSICSVSFSLPFRQYAFTQHSRTRRYTIPFVSPAKCLLTEYTGDGVGPEVNQAHGFLGPSLMVHV